MTSRERILDSLEHHEPAGLAIDFGATGCSSIHLAAYKRLRDELGVGKGSARVSDLIQQIAEVEPEIADILGTDATGLYFYPERWRLWEEGYDFTVEVPLKWRPERTKDKAWVLRDPDGIVRQRRTADGLYFDPVSFPLQEVRSIEALADQVLFERWDWPSVYDESLTEYARRAKRMRDSMDKAIVANWNMHYLQSGQMLRGYEQFMVDLLADEQMVRAVWDALHRVYMHRAKRFLQAVGDFVDVIFLTDDLGTQHGPMISPEIYRKLLKPYWAELIGLLKIHRKKILMHSCGAISEFLPDLIEMGVDAINPVQITAAGMSPERLKNEFGNSIAFWGGGVSTQGMLDRAAPQQIQDEVRRNIETFAPGGGYIFTQVHNIQANVPTQNILAAYKTALEYT